MFVRVAIDRARPTVPIGPCHALKLRKAFGVPFDEDKIVERGLNCERDLRGTSANRVIVDLIETGLEAREQEKKRFFDLADRLSKATDGSEQKRLKEQLARLTFGE